LRLLGDGGGRPAPGGPRHRPRLHPDGAGRGRYLAKSPYTVQVKSDFKPVVFEGKEAVRWVIGHPLPLYLCVVDKSAARLSVYHTFARFCAWACRQRPDGLQMTPEPPTPGGTGQCTQWEGSYPFSLGQPILDFTVTQMLDDDFWAKARGGRGDAAAP